MRVLGCVPARFLRVFARFCAFFEPKWAKKAVFSPFFMVFETFSVRVYQKGGRDFSPHPKPPVISPITTTHKVVGSDPLPIMSGLGVASRFLIMKAPILYYSGVSNKRSAMLNRYSSFEAPPSRLFFHAMLNRMWGIVVPHATLNAPSRLSKHRRNFFCFKSGKGEEKEKRKGPVSPGGGRLRTVAAAQADFSPFALLPEG